MKLTTFAAALKARKADQKGFTLIELIIVIAIIGILVAIAIPVYGAIQDNARQQATNAAASNVLTAAVAAESDDDAATTAASVIPAEYGTNVAESGDVITVLVTATGGVVTATATHEDGQTAERQANF